MRAISPIISIMMVITLSIIVAGAGAAVFFSITQDSSDEANQSAKHFIHDKTINLRIESATSNSLKIRNLGTSSVNYDEIYILDSNNNEISFSGEGDIETKSTEVLEFSTALEKGSYKLVTPLIDVPFKVEEQEVHEFTLTCGTELEPCRIYNETQLNSIRDSLNFHYILMSDIDLSGFDDDGNPNNGNWIPVGKTFSTPFIGTLDGNGHVISNMNIKEGTQSYTAFFGAFKGTVKNIGFKDSIISNENSSYIGGIVGLNYGTIENSYMKGSVTTNATVGGLVGLNAGTIKNSYSTANISGNGISVGGLVGANHAIIKNSYVTGSVSGSSNVGELVGGTSSVTCTNSYWKIQNSETTTSNCGVMGKTSSELQSPTSATGIYSEWTDTYTSPLSGNTGVQIWKFGTDEDYPKLEWEP